MMIILFALSFPSAGSQARSLCTATGTAGHDKLVGGPLRDFLCARGAPDYANGKGGADTIRGGPGNDTVVGGDGIDRLRGLGGNDELFATDTNAGDVVDGGRGFDRCYGDRGDHFKRCEHRVRV